jgi:hypothetical protein
MLPQCNMTLRPEGHAAGTGRAVMESTVAGQWQSRL